VALQVRVIDGPAQVAFEVAVVNDIEPHERAKETPVGFDDTVAKQVAARGQALLELIERVEQFLARDLIRALARREPGAVNAVVDVLIKKIAALAVLGLDLFGEK